MGSAASVEGAESAGGDAATVHGEGPVPQVVLLGVQARRLAKRSKDAGNARVNASGVVSHLDILVRPGSPPWNSNVSSRPRCFIESWDLKCRVRRFWLMQVSSLGRIL